MKVYQANNGFLWADVTNEAKEIFSSGTFELHAIHEDGSESLIEDISGLNTALENNWFIAIQLCFLDKIVKM